MLSSVLKYLRFDRVKTQEKAESFPTKAEEEGESPESCQAGLHLPPQQWEGWELLP